MSFTELMASQVSLNTDRTLFRDQRVSKMLQALQESRRTSQHQNERIEHEKHELKTLLSRLCKLQEGNVNMNGLYNDEDSLTSSLSSNSSLSIVGPARETGEESTKLSSNFSSFHWYCRSNEKLTLILAIFTLLEDFVQLLCVELLNFYFNCNNSKTMILNGMPCY